MLLVIQNQPADGHPRRVFVSYSHQDEPWKRRVVKALKPIEQQQHLGTILTVADDGLTVSISYAVLTIDGKRAVSASRDRTVKVWNLQNGEVLATFIGDEPITTCAVTPDGGTVVAGESSGRIHFLRLVMPDDPLE